MCIVLNISFQFNTFKEMYCAVSKVEDYFPIAELHVKLHTIIMVPNTNVNDKPRPFY